MGDLGVRGVCSRVLCYLKVCFQLKPDAAVLQISAINAGVIKSVRLYQVIFPNIKIKSAFIIIISAFQGGV
jgi:hypothetical protein